MATFSDAKMCESLAAARVYCQFVLIQVVQLADNKNMEQSIDSIEILTLANEASNTVLTQQNKDPLSSWMSQELKVTLKKNLKKKRERNICSVVHCRSYRDANHWPEPLTFHEFPADLRFNYFIF